MTACSCTKSSSLSKQHLRINIHSEPQSLDPRKARDLNAVTLMHMLFEGLTRIGKEGNVELALAKDCEISEDGLCYLFHLRDAVWSDGKPITSFDFSKSWAKTLSPSFPSDVAYQLYSIKGAKLKKQGEQGEIGIKTPDPYTLIVELEEPLPYFLELLSTPIFFPVQSQLDDENPHWSENASSYISNGPFLMRSWKHSDQIELIRNPSYWEAKEVKLEHIDLFMVSNEIELRMFEEGALDWAGSPLSTLPPDAINHLKKRGSLRVSPLLGTYFLRVNTEDPVLNNADLRRALAFAINRNEIVEHILQGGQTPATALTPPSLRLAMEGFFQDASIPKGKELHHTAVEELLKQELTLTLLYQQTDRNHLIVQTLQQQLKKTLGVNLILEAVEKQTFYERISKKQYQLAAGSWIADYNDPINFLEVFKFRASSTNNTGWEDPKYVDCLSRSSVCRNSEERRILLRNAEELLMTQMPIIPIFHFAMNYLQRDDIEDVALSSIGQIDFRWARRNL